MILIIISFLYLQRWNERDAEPTARTISGGKQPSLAVGIWSSCAGSSLNGRVFYYILRLYLRAIGKHLVQKGWKPLPFPQLQATIKYPISKELNYYHSQFQSVSNGMEHTETLVEPKKNKNRDEVKEKQDELVLLWHQMKEKWKFLNHHYSNFFGLENWVYHKF